jgi:hypothetical protein
MTAGRILAVGITAILAVILAASLACTTALLIVYAVAAVAA